MTADEADAAHAGSPSRVLTRTKLIVVGLLLGVAIGGGSLVRDYLSLEYFAQQQEALLAFRADHPVLVYGIAFAIYVAVTGLSLPGAAGLTLVYGWFFDVLPAIVLVSFASTTGATLAFVLSRYLLRDSVQAKFGDRLRRFNSALEREGAFYLFTLRLVPLVPFFAINVVMGLTPISTTTFWLVSQIGMLPGTFVYVFAGSSVPDLATLAEQGLGGILTPRLLIAFTILGVFPLVVRKAVQYLRPTSLTADEAAANNTPPQA